MRGQKPSGKRDARRVITERAGLPTVRSSAFSELPARPIERAEYLRAWLERYNQVHGAAKRGRKPKGAPMDDRLPRAIERQLGISVETFYRHLSIARKIGPDLRQRLAKHRMGSNAAQLRRLAKEPPERQIKIIDVLCSKPQRAMTVAAVIQEIDGAAEAFQAIGGGGGQLASLYRGLSMKEQAAFFAAIEGDCRRSFVIGDARGRIEQDHEMAAFITARVGVFSTAEILADLTWRFAGCRLPPRSTFNRYVARVEAQKGIVCTKCKQ